MQQLLGSTDFTEALMYILVDWEKNCYTPDKIRLLEQMQLRFAILQNLSVKPEAEETAST